MSPSSGVFKFFPPLGLHVCIFKVHQHLRSLAPVMNDDDGQMIFGDLGGLKLPDIVLQVRKNPVKTSLRKPVPTGDRTRARCLTGVHAASWPTALDPRPAENAKSHI